MVYFGQDGCPYCTAADGDELLAARDRRQDAPAFRRDRAQHLGRPRDDVDRRARCDREGARPLLDVQFTPTLLFFDEHGSVVARLNGYYPPHRFEAVARLCRREEARAQGDARGVPGRATGAGCRESRDARRRALLRCRRRTTCGAQGRRQAARGGVRDAALRARATSCIAKRFARPQMQTLLGALRRRALRARRAHRARHARRRKSRRRDAWARDLGVAYTPTIVFFDAERTRGVSHRRVPAAVPPRLGARLRRERRVSRRTLVPALHPGARGAPARAGRDRRSLAISPRRLHAPASDQQHHHETEGCHGAAHDVGTRGRQA